MRSSGSLDLCKSASRHVICACLLRSLGVSRQCRSAFPSKCLASTCLTSPFDVLQKACDAVKANVKADDAESIFYATTVANTLKTRGKVTCSVSAVTCVMTSQLRAR